VSKNEKPQRSNPLAILQSTELPTPQSAKQEDVKEARQQDGLPANQPDVQAEIQQSVQPASHPDVEETRQHNNKHAPQQAVQPSSQPSSQQTRSRKITARVSPEAGDYLEDIKILLRRRYGLHEIDLQDIMDEGIKALYHDLQANQHDSILYRRVADNPAYRHKI
jgi:uncharacterized protein involved in copper resistance